MTSALSFFKESTMKRFMLSAIVAGLGVCAAFAVISARAEPKDADPAPDAEKITALQKERRDLLREVVNSAEEGHRTGVLAYSAVSRAMTAWLNAELDLAANHAERVAVREKILTHAENVEKTAGEAFKVGNADRTDLLEAKAARLQAEIDLLRERAPK